MIKKYVYNEYEYYGIRYEEFKDCFLKKVNCEKQILEDDDYMEDTHDIVKAMKFNEKIDAENFINNFFIYPECWEVFLIKVRYDYLNVEG